MVIPVNPIQVSDKTMSTVQTTDSTQTTIATLAIPNGSSGLIEAFIIARDGNGATAAWNVLQAFKNVSNTVSLVGSLGSIYVPTPDAGIATASVTVTASGSNVLVKVTGIIASNIAWQVFTNVYIN